MNFHTISRAGVYLYHISLDPACGDVPVSREEIRYVQLCTMANSLVALPLCDLVLKLVSL